MDTNPVHYLHVLAELLHRFEATDAHRQPLAMGEAMTRAHGLIHEAGQAGRKVLAIGNGGSGSIAAHLQMDLCNLARIRTLAFDSMPMQSALANDHGAAEVFVRPVALWAERGDVLMAISSSGNSPNILKAAEAARAAGASVLTFSGFRADNPLRGLGDVNFYIPASIYGHVEVAHLAVCHALADLATASLPERTSHAHA